MAEALLDSEIMRRLEQVMLVSRKLSSGRLRGERRSKRRGSSNDFADYRNYVTGDDLRYLDWKIYARLERLFLKLFLEEEDLRVQILVDISPSMAWGEPEKLLYAKRVAAALGYVTMNRMDSLTACGFGQTLGATFGPRRGKVNGHRYFSFLEHLEVAEGTSLTESLRRFSLVTRSAGLVIVISDFLDPGGYEEGLRLLFGRGFETCIIQVLAPEELKPTVTGDVRLVDVEFGDTTDVSVGPALMELYDRTLNTFCDGLKDYVTKRGGTYVLCSTQTPFERLVLDVLCRKGMVR